MVKLTETAITATTNIIAADASNVGKRAGIWTSKAIVWGTAALPYVSLAYMVTVCLPLGNPTKVVFPIMVTFACPSRLLAVHCAGCVRLDLSFN